MPSIFTAVHEDVELQHDEDVKLMMVDNMYFFQVKMPQVKKLFKISPCASGRGSRNTLRSFLPQAAS